MISKLLKINYFNKIRDNQLKAIKWSDLGRCSNKLEIRSKTNSYNRKISQ